jgi:hypothetical protein
MHKGRNREEHDNGDHESRRKRTRLEEDDSDQDFCTSLAQPAPIQAAQEEREREVFAPIRANLHWYKPLPEAHGLIFTENSYGSCCGGPLHWVTTRWMKRRYLLILNNYTPSP